MKQTLRTFWALLAMVAVVLATALPHAVSAATLADGAMLADGQETSHTNHRADPVVHGSATVTDCASATFMHSEEGGCAATASQCFSLLSAKNAQPEQPWTLTFVAFAGEPTWLSPVVQARETPPPRT